MVQFSRLENEPLMLAAFGQQMSADQRNDVSANQRLILNGNSQLKLNHYAAERLTYCLT